MSTRFKELDSLRGLAALAVVFGHLFQTFPIADAPIRLLNPASWLDPVTYLRYSPLRVFVSGRSAVIMFFILSGFVLSLPYIKGKAPRYWSYIIKRFCRIYIPFACAIFFASFLYSEVDPRPIADLSNWFNARSWFSELTPEMIARHLLMTGAMQDMQINNVMWSLVHEMRISIIFPVIALVVLKRPAHALALFFAIWFVSEFVADPLLDDDIWGSLNDTIGYTFFFAVGATLALKRDWLIEIARGLDRRTVATIMVISICLLAIPAGVPAAEFLFGIGSAGIIVLALSRQAFQKALHFSTIEGLGRVSYSLYLFHLPILLFVFTDLYGKANPFLLAGAILLIALLVAEIAYRLIEGPSILLGRRLTRGETTPAPSLK